MDAAAPIFRLFDREEALRSHVNDDPGTHNYELDNRQALYRMLGDFFYPGDESFNPEEIPSQDELKSKEELFVELPAENEDFHTLALRLSKSLPREPEVPEEADALLTWQQSRRATLRQIVRAKDYEVNAIRFDEEDAAGVKATLWKLQMGGTWTVPPGPTVTTRSRSAHPWGILLSPAGAGPVYSRRTIHLLSTSAT